MSRHVDQASRRWVCERVLAPAPDGVPPLHVGAQT
jgi:hypothetical protein